VALNKEWHRLYRMPPRATRRFSSCTGDADPAINVRFGERLFAVASEPKKFGRFPGGGHENLDEFGAIDTVRRFIGASNG
jgi:hypothetical protein